MDDPSNVAGRLAFAQVYKTAGTLSEFEVAQARLDHHRSAITTFAIETRRRETRDDETVIARDRAVFDTMFDCMYTKLYKDGIVANHLIQSNPSENTIHTIAMATRASEKLHTAMLESAYHTLMYGDKSTRPRVPTTDAEHLAFAWDVARPMFRAQLMIGILNRVAELDSTTEPGLLNELFMLLGMDEMGITAWQETLAAAVDDDSETIPSLAIAAGIAQITLGLNTLIDDAINQVLLPELDAYELHSSLSRIGSNTNNNELPMGIGFFRRTFGMLASTIVSDVSVTPTDIRNFLSNLRQSPVPRYTALIDAIYNRPALSELPRVLDVRNQADVWKMRDWINNYVFRGRISDEHTDFQNDPPSYPQILPPEVTTLMDRLSRFVEQEPVDRTVVNNNNNNDPGAAVPSVDEADAVYNEGGAALVRSTASPVAPGWFSWLMGRRQQPIDTAAMATWPPIPGNEIWRDIKVEWTQSMFREYLARLIDLSEVSKYFVITTRATNAGATHQEILNVPLNWGSDPDTWESVLEDMKSSLQEMHPDYTHEDINETMDRYTVYMEKLRVIYSLPGAIIREHNNVTNEDDVVGGLWLRDALRVVVFHDFMHTIIVSLTQYIDTYFSERPAPPPPTNTRRTPRRQLMNRIAWYVLDITRPLILDATFLALHEYSRPVQALGLVLVTVGQSGLMYSLRDDDNASFLRILGYNAVLNTVAVYAGGTSSSRAYPQQRPQYAISDLRYDDSTGIRHARSVTLYSDALNTDSLTVDDRSRMELARTLVNGTGLDQIAYDAFQRLRLENVPANAIYRVGMGVYVVNTIMMSAYHLIWNVRDTDPNIRAASHDRTRFWPNDRNSDFSYLRTRFLPGDTGDELADRVVDQLTDVMITRLNTDPTLPGRTLTQHYFLDTLSRVRIAEGQPDTYIRTVAHNAVIAVRARRQRNTNRPLFSGRLATALLVGFPVAGILGGLLFSWYHGYGPISVMSFTTGLVWRGIVNGVDSFVVGLVNGALDSNVTSIIPYIRAFGTGLASGLALLYAGIYGIGMGMMTLDASYVFNLITTVGSSMQYFTFYIGFLMTGYFNWRWIRWLFRQILSIIPHSPPRNTNNGNQSASRDEIRVPRISHNRDIQERFDILYRRWSNADTRLNLYNTFAEVQTMVERAVDDTVPHLTVLNYITNMVTTLLDIMQGSFAVLAMYAAHVIPSIPQYPQLAAVVEQNSQQQVNITWLVLSQGRALTQWITAARDYVISQPVGWATFFAAIVLLVKVAALVVLASALIRWYRQWRTSQ